MKRRMVIGKKKPQHRNYNHAKTNLSYVLSKAYYPPTPKIIIIIVLQTNLCNVHIQFLLLHLLIFINTISCNVLSKSVSCIFCHIFLSEIFFLLHSTITPLAQLICARFFAQSVFGKKRKEKEVACYARGQKEPVTLSKSLL